jgi:mannose-1-phosphate guanylyltransferase / phosphomannomutase
MPCSTLDPVGTQGVVLAGAYPKGRSLFDRLRPRPLLPVAHAPLAAYPLRWLSEGGLRNATVCVNSAARSLRESLSDETDLPQSVDFYEDWMPRGTAGCVRDVGFRTSARTLVVVDGTTIPCLDLRELLDFHVEHGAAVTVAAYCEGGPASSPIALSPCGVYVFDRKALDYVGSRGFQDIKETLLPRLHAAGEGLEVFVVAQSCPPVLDADTYLAVSQWMISRVVSEGLGRHGYHALEEALVHSSAQVAGDARLLGPVLLGPDVTVEAGATVVGPTEIGRGSRVGRGSVVSRSVTWSHCWVGPESMVDHCLLSDQTVVAPRSALNNTLKAGRLNRRPFVNAEPDAPVHGKPLPLPTAHG